MKSIFGRLMLLSMVIIFTCVIALGIINITLLNSYTINTRSAELKQAAENAAQYLVDLSAQQFRTAVIQTIYKAYVDSVSRMAQTHIVVTNTTGAVFFFSSSATHHVNTYQIDISELIEDYDSHVRDRFIYGQDMLNVTAAIIDNGETMGYVFASAPYPAVNTDLSDVYRLFIISLISAATIGFLLSLFLSKQISSPIHQLSAVAASIAQGEFKPIEIKGKIKEIDKLGESFSKMSEALQNTETVRRDFVSSVSHDLRSPITSIDGFVGGILDGTIPPDKQQYYLTIVKNEAERMAALVTDYLDLSKYESGAIGLNLRSFDINEMLRMIIASYEQMFQNKWQTVTLQLTQQELYVCADYDAIKRVVCNIVENAIKYGEKGGKITIEAAADKFKDGKKAAVSITNTGNIISEQDLPYIFDRFYKSDKARSPEYKSSGLGLYIVKSIMNQHGEQVTVQSKDNATRFTIMLKMA